MSEAAKPASRATAAFRKAQQEARVRSSHIGVPVYASSSPPRSGVQPDARGMVLCPFCRKTFPFSAALLSRQLRCSGCRGVFRVGDDRRSFRIQAVAEQPSVEAGTLSKLTRAAISNANTSLNEAAAEALRAISRQDRPPPPGSGTKIHVHTAPAGESGTRSIRRKRPTAVLTGEGVVEGRRRSMLNAILIAVVIAILASTAVIWRLRTDHRVDALWKYQGAATGGRNGAGSIAALRSAGLSDRIEPIIDIEGASLSKPLVLDLSRLRTAITGKRLLQRGIAWIDASRISEAGALAAGRSLADAKAMAEFRTACQKAGIDLLTWPELIAAAAFGQPAEANGALELLLNQPQARAGAFDAVALLDAGKFPDRITMCLLTGDRGTLLLPSAPAVHPIAYRGRMLRCEGTGWPGDWMLLDLSMVKP